MKNQNIEVAEPKVSKTDIYTIPPSMIYIENPNVRDAYPEQEYQNLKESIRINGVIEPIHVRKTPKGYALTHGFNRMRAVWELIEEGVQIVGVKAISSKLSTEEELVRHITLNSGVPLTKFEISKVLIQLQGFGWKNKDISAKLGYSEQEVSNLLTFQNQASMELKNAVKDGLIDINPALSLIRETENTKEQNVVLEKAKAKVKSENRTKIKSTDVLSKKISFQDKMSKTIELFAEVPLLPEKKRDQELLTKLYELLLDKENTPEDIVKKLVK
jgi:ParB family chromosome partitioning protein